MDSITIGIIVIVLAAIALFIYNRSRPAPRGTYDDPKVSSSGSIGGGPRAHDDPNVSSGGSIGGGPRAYDTPEVKSGGSIGNQSTEDRRVRSEGGQESRSRLGRNSEQRNSAAQNDRDEDNEVEDKAEDNEKPKYNDRTLKSGGSFGS